MVSGEIFHFKNFYCNSIRDFLTKVLMRNRVQLNWYEVLPGFFVQVSQIESIKELSQSEVEEINQEMLKDGDEVIFPENKLNKELPKKSDSDRIKMLNTQKKVKRKKI